MCLQLKRGQFLAELVQFATSNCPNETAKFGSCGEICRRKQKIICALIQLNSVYLCCSTLPQKWTISAGRLSSQHLLTGSPVVNSLLIFNPFDPLGSAVCWVQDPLTVALGLEQPCQMFHSLFMCGSFGAVLGLIFCDCHGNISCNEIDKELFHAMSGTLRSLVYIACIIASTSFYDQKPLPHSLPPSLPPSLTPSARVVSQILAAQERRSKT